LALNPEIVLTSIPFDSATKRATVVIRKADGDVRVYTKGAPDVLYGKDLDKFNSLV
jgi:magnesium-transporting ATPase (P-type)